jgi:hypothetical protein
MTTLGHGLLNQMNTISSYAADKNFVQAITSASSTAGEKQSLHFKRRRNCTLKIKKPKT